MMKKYNQSFTIQSKNGKNRQFLVCCLKMERLLNRHIVFQNHSSVINGLNFSFILETNTRPKPVTSLSKKDTPSILHIQLPIDYPYFFELDEDNMKQVMIEVFLEAIFVAAEHDNSLDELYFYNEIKQVFYKNGWLTRVIFPALC